MVEFIFGFEFHELATMWDGSIEASVYFCNEAALTFLQFARLVHEDMRVAPNALYILQKLMHGPDVVRARLKMMMMIQWFLLLLLGRVTQTYIGRPGGRPVVLFG